MTTQVGFESLTEQEKYQAFLERLDRGEKIEVDDWMPDDYRQALIRLIAMHGISEIMGALPEKEWVPKAPTLHRKMAIMAKVQDEMGHGQLLLRVAEDLMAYYGKDRDDIYQDLFSGRLKFHNVFHMTAPTWADAGVIAWLVDGAAIVTQKSLLDTSYGPYGRVLQRICAEEVFHMQHGESIILELAEGTEAQRQALQEAVNRWWPALLMFFGPPEGNQLTKHQEKNLRYKIRTKTNEGLRQEFLDKYVPRIWALGLTVPDETIHYDEKQQKWIYQQPDWDEFRAIVNNNGPKSQERLRLRKSVFENAGWVRDILAVRTLATG
ncbi:ring-1,2-phenylacetyl-CoA epoxidase subunit PaaA [Caldalkalibacillus uzonensis]|uniref:Ring-1,2-phenylacetyl-CoA epoxidase subunit PaaA n=1 Tax=Caldalkalibacillus uzonensis TaxID=353224 RepID=A0ABU0CRB6_9BACI|nr:1,2-phenylacetyl-CoA epoxidase subunit PaaA [Caldalkalibacillus uzonensis]MDQ0338964.1 ring-1,2-phenylacetyl-CoA epoxidase subunit PaaA [Caldalkalibacillus uzonensis]